MRRSRMALALGPLLLVLPLLGGCSEDPVPKVAPHQSPSASESPVADVQRTPVATVRAWVNAQNAAMRSGDTSGARALSTSNCESCDGMIDPIDKVFNAGGYFHTKGWVIDAAKLAHADSTSAKVNAAVTVRGGTTLTGTGEDPVSYGPDKRIVVFKLTNEHDEWLVSFIGFLS